MRFKNIKPSFLFILVFRHKDAGSIACVFVLDKRRNMYYAKRKTMEATYAESSNF